MTQMTEMPRVQSCTVSGCSYNHDGCRAFAITIGRSNSECNTFMDSADKGGFGTLTAQVGACQKADCKFNKELECQAPSITVAPGKDLADCMTYEQR